MQQSNKHEAKIIDSKKLSNGQIAILARCCDDESTDSWHTVNSLGIKDKAHADAIAAEHCAATAKEHEAIGTVHEHFKKLHE